MSNRNEGAVAQVAGSPGSPVTSAKGGPTSVPSADFAHEEAALELAKLTHANLQDMVKVADAKATTLVALHTLILAITGSGIAEQVGCAWRVGSTLGWLFVGTTASMVVVTTVSALFSIGVLKPRFPEHLLPPSGASGLLWIKKLGEYVGTGRATSPRCWGKRTGGKADLGPDAYLKEIRAVTDGRLLAELAFENLKVAWILDRKFAWLRRAIWSLISAVALWIITLAAAARFAEAHGSACR